MEAKLLKKIFISKADSSFLQFFRYFLVGGISTVFDFGFLFLFTSWLHIPYLISAALSFLIGLTVNYFLSILWVFSRKNIKSRSKEISVILLIGIAGLLLNELIIWGLTDKLSIYYMLSKLVATAIVYFWNFLSRKYLLYR